MSDALRHNAERRALKELDAIYRKVAQLQQGWTCALSGDCCQLAKTGREPYVWPLEWLRVKQGLAEQGRALPLAPRADGACPLLDARGRCGLYADRPLGCRTFFCERGHGPTKISRDQITALMVRLERVATELDPEVEQPVKLVDRLAYLDP